MIPQVYSTLKLGLDSWQSVIKDRSQISVQKIVSALRKITQKLDTRVRYKICAHSSLDTDQIILSAVYDDDLLEYGLDFVQVYVNVQNTNQKFDITQDFIGLLRSEFLQTIVHELEHKNQAIKRNNKNKYQSLDDTELDYLTRRDEINAYACGIAVSLWDRYSDTGWKYICSPSQFSDINTDLMLYSQARSTGLDEKYWRCLLKQTASAMQQLENQYGQRFRTGTK